MIFVYYTTGAMAGALFGAAYGINIFPNEFTNFLEDREKIIKLAESLYYTFKYRDVSKGA